MLEVQKKRQTKQNTNFRQKKTRPFLLGTPSIHYSTTRCLAYLHIQLQFCVARINSLQWIQFEFHTWFYNTKIVFGIFSGDELAEECIIFEEQTIDFL